MGVESPSLIETLVDEDIGRLVGDAARDGIYISAAAAADQILKAYPTCGFGAHTLANRIMMAAARAGIAVKIGPAEPAELSSGRS